jgi:hypothetical protein
MVAIIRTVFDDLLRQLDRISKTRRISVNVMLDEDGYFDRGCPAGECSATFKVEFTDWKNKVPNQQAWCPICGEIAKPSEFNTPAQKRGPRNTLE